MTYIQTKNQVIYDTLPEFHWLSPSNKIALSEDNRKNALWEYLTLAEFVEKKKTEFTLKRELANNSTFVWNGKTFDGSKDSRDKIIAINGAVVLTEPKSLPANWVGGWKAEDNSIVAIPDVATWESFYLAMISVGQTNFIQSETLKGQVQTILENSALTEVEKFEQILNVNWS